MQDSIFKPNSYKGHSNIVEMLIQKSKYYNININSKTTLYGWNAFHLACVAGRANIVELLINYAISFEFDFFSEDNRGKSGLQLAESFDKAEVVNLIKKKLTL